jgi:hypothetical protein
MNFDADTCYTFPDDKVLHGFELKDKCSCNACDKACKFEQNPTVSVLEGFGFFKVLVVYGVVLIATVVIFFLKKNKKNRSDPVDSLPINKEYRESENLTTNQI